MVTHPMKPSTYTVSSGYGSRWGTFHAGLDFACPVGTPIYAAGDGVVVQGTDRAQGSVDGFGSWIWIDCQDSVGVDLVYGHVHHPGILVKAGDRVKAGQQIGVSGNEGETTGPHLHFEVWGPPGKLGGQHRDPAPWLKGATAPGGAKPPSTGGSTTVGNTIFGVDVSSHQDGMSLKRAKDEGIRFAILRLCDGTYVDSAFKSHLADAEGAGLLVSTYWYLRAPSEGTTISQQVDVIDRQMGGRKDLGVWIDVESVDKSGAFLLRESDVWDAKRELERRGYYVPGIYSGAWYWEKMPGGEPSMDGLGHLWVSNYGPSNAKGPYRQVYRGDADKAWNYPLGDRKPDILQYGSQGGVAGWHVDVNAYRGTVEQLRSIFTGKQSDKKPTKPKEGTVTDYARLAYEQDVGPGFKDGEHTCAGWDLLWLIEQGKRKIRETGGCTTPELLAVCNEDKIRELIAEGKQS